MVVMEKQCGNEINKSRTILLHAHSVSHTPRVQFYAQPAHSGAETASTALGQLGTRQPGRGSKDFF